ncbi:MAG: universal stress protein [Humidesulfovibrio sp.]|nr:universal stress protein [Humidesulfovibrio sp.]
MKILVAVDPSDTVFLPVSKAADIAKKEGAELTLLTVAEAEEDMNNYLDGNIIERLREQATKTLDAAAAVARGAGVTPKIELETGLSPEEYIVDTAKDGGFDLIVTGTRGKKGVRRLLLGSVASKVVTLASCSVLVVR